MGVRPGISLRKGTAVSLSKNAREQAIRSWVVAEGPGAEIQPTLCIEDKDIREEVRSDMADWEAFEERVKRRG